MVLHAIALLFVPGMVLTLRKRQDKSRKRKSQKDGGSSGSDAGNGGDDMQSDDEVHVEGGTAWAGTIDRNEVDERECEHNDGVAEAAAAAASAAANEKHSVFMEPSPSCISKWSYGSLEQQNITSFGALQEEIAGLSFKLVDWDEATRTAQERSIKSMAQLSVHDAASSKAALPDDKAFHFEAAAQKRADIE